MWISYTRGELHLRKGSKATLLELSLERLRSELMTDEYAEARQCQESTNSEFFEVKTRTDSILMVLKGYWIMGHALDKRDPMM